MVGCAGERMPTGLVTSESSDDVVVGTSYTLVFSAIDAAVDGSGATTVTVKLENGNVVVTDGKLSQVMVMLKYRVRNTAGPDFEEFAAGGKSKLRRGAATFRVRLGAGRVQQLRAEADVNNNGEWTDNGIDVWSESGIFSVPSGEETDVIEESL